MGASIFEGIPLQNYQQSKLPDLLALTEKLFQNEVFANYLTPQQLLILEHIITYEDLSARRQIWDALMQGNIYLDVVNNSSEKQTPEAQTPKTPQPKEDEDYSNLDLEDLEQQIKGTDFIGNLSLKLRYVLWQFALPCDQDDPAGDLEPQNMDYILLNTEDSNSSSSTATTTTVTDNSSPKEAKLDISPDRAAEDEDYDDYDEDEPVKKKAEAPEPVLTVINRDSSNRLVLTLEISKDTLPKLQPRAVDDVIYNWHRIYHSFEYDKETLLKRLKLEKNDKLIETESPKRKLDDSDDDDDNDHRNVPTEEVEGDGPHKANNKENSTELDERKSKKPKHDSQPLPVHFGISNLPIKHLLSSIQTNRSKVDISDYELKQLLNDVRKNKSKWSSDERIGQEELYEACEKVILELRNQTEHSTPFLNKVNKRDAPNYHMIIKKSMDLNTVYKKLKSFQYNSKQEFVDDIMLIWKNCLTYNSDPSHFLRTHAIAMQKKSLQLIPTIPNITIRSRKEMEMELEELEKDADYEEEDESQEVAGSGRKGLNMGAHMPAKQQNTENQLEVPTESNTEVGTPAQQTPDVATNSLPESEHPSSTDITAETKAETTEEHNQRDTHSEEEVEDEEEEEDEIATSQAYFYKDADVDDLELSVWKSLTAKARAELCLQRSSYFTNGKINMQPQALLKNAQKMKPFQLLLAEFKAQKSLRQRNTQIKRESIMKNSFGTSVGVEDEDTNEPEESNNIDTDDMLFLQEYDINNSYPRIDYCGVPIEHLERMEAAAVDKLLTQDTPPESIYLKNKDKGLTPKINKNIALIQNVRHICHKISLIRTLQSPANFQSKRGKNNATLADVQQYKYLEVDDSVDIDPVSQLPTHNYKNDRNLMWTILHKNVSKIAMSNGFETTEPLAINMLTEIAIAYLSNLIRTVKLHWETNSLNMLRPKEILEMSLLENGIPKPDDLYNYMESEFKKKTKKLDDIKNKLENFLKSLLRPTLQDLSERNFEDESQSFLTGDFTSELTGEDFFGFRELGLEKEFGILSSSVPLQLLTYRFQATEVETKEEVKKLQPEEFTDIIYSRVTKSHIESNTYSPMLTPLLKKAYEKSRKFVLKPPRGVVLDAHVEATKDTLDSPEYVLLEDPEMGVKPRGNSRIRLPPNGKIAGMHKKKPLEDAFILPEDPKPDYQPQLKPESEVVSDATPSGEHKTAPQDPSISGPMASQSPEPSTSLQDTKGSEDLQPSFTLSLPKLPEQS